MWHYTCSFLRVGSLSMQDSCGDRSLADGPRAAAVEVLRFEAQLVIRDLAAALRSVRPHSVSPEL